jgi:hypothetical protein
LFLIFSAASAISLTFSSQKHLNITLPHYNDKYSTAAYQKIMHRKKNIIEYYWLIRITLYILVVRQVKRTIFNKDIDFQVIRKYKFIHDGIINEEAYCKSEPRILFLLKESNDDYTEIALEDGAVNPTNGNSTLFWRKLNIIQYILEKTWAGKPVSVFLR